MTVTVLHNNNYEEWTRGNAILRDVRDDADHGRVREALAAGLFLAVATVEGSDPGRAYAGTQNGPHGSWSRRPPAGVTPLGEGTVSIPGAGGPLGYRDTQTGDLLVVDGKVHVLGLRGIEATDIPAPPEGSIRVVGAPVPDA